MFDTFNQFVQDMTSGMSTTGKIILGLMAVVFIIITGSRSISAFGRGDLGKGFIFLGFTIAIIVVSIIIYGAVRGVSKGMGKDMNSKYKLMPLLTIMPLMYHTMRYKLEQRKLRKQHKVITNV